ncbi:MAG: hypothetical protein IJL74_03585 [Bacilli bacterium]|nr:hypothetical protein [Bacilli bacterium]
MQMENQKDKKARIMAIVGLLLGVVGLSLGFAAFSNTLTIKSSAEVVVDDSVFNVDFSSSSSSVVDDDITPTLNPTGVTGFTASNAVIDNDNGDAVIKNLHAVFTAPGQEVTYSFFTKNAGELKAYLKSITFSNVSGESSTKICTAKSGTTQSLVNTACTGITLTVTVGSEAFTGTTLRSAFANATAHDLNKDASETVEVRIAYETGSAQADGGFDVSFGDVTLLYSSAV